MHAQTEKKDTANPVLHQKIASSRRLNLTEAFAPEIMKIV